MKKFKVFALLLATMGLMASCNNEPNNKPKPEQGTQTISLKLAQPETKALETPVTADQVEFETVTLYYWTDINGTIAASPASRLLSAADITTATTDPDGLKINVGNDVKSVSMTANTSLVKEDGADYPINKVQGLGADFMKKVPMTAPAVQPIAHTNPGLTGAKLVTLVPVPDLARIEVVGTIAPTANTKTGTSSYEYVHVEAVYINNYKATKDATGLNKTESSGSWSTYEATMHDAANVNSELEAGKAAGYQIFPAETAADEDKLPHVVLKITYKEKTAASPVTDRYITIVKYKEGPTPLTKFEGGKIYKLDLSALNDLFSTDDSGEIVDPTDPKPEMPKTDLYVKITPYSWTVANITPDF